MNNEKITINGIKKEFNLLFKSSRKRKLALFRKFSRRVWKFGIKFTTPSNPYIASIVWAIISIMFYTNIPITMIIGEQKPMIIRLPKNELLAILTAALAIMDFSVVVNKIYIRHMLEGFTLLYKEIAKLIKRLLERQVA